MTPRAPSRRRPRRRSGWPRSAPGPAGTPGGRSRAAGTERAYAGDWTRFQLWCLDLDLCPLPAGPLTVALYLTHLAPAWRPATREDPPEQVAAGELVASRKPIRDRDTMTVSRWLL